MYVRGDQEDCLKIVYEWYMENVVLSFISNERNILLEGQGGWTWPSSCNEVPRRAG